MLILKSKGKRIKARDENIIYHLISTSIYIIFLVVMIFFHLQSLLDANWQVITLEDITEKLQTPYFWASVITALFVCTIFCFLYYHYRFDKVNQLQHRQKLARMILQNGWYEKSETQTEGFFKDLPQSKRSFIFVDQLVQPFVSSYNRRIDQSIGTLKEKESLHE